MGIVEAVFDRPVTIAALCLIFAGFMFVFSHLLRRPSNSFEHRDNADNRTFGLCFLTAGEFLLILVGLLK